VVDDSPTVRGRLREALRADPEVLVVAEAGDGKQAIDLCRELRPDVVTMDMALPVMSGLAATEYIMAHCPTPILIVSCSTNRADLFKTYDALAAGAVDVLEKPDGAGSDEEWDRQFLAAIKMAARIRVITHPRARLGLLTRPVAPPAPPGGQPRVVALGASTGGPAALMRILSALPRDYQVPVLVVLHIGRVFEAALADWLASYTALPVSYARDGERLEAVAGRIVMAPPDQHLTLRSGTLALSWDAERHGCRPSVDVLFESVARECGSAAVAAVLTGMGRDGAAGLLEIKRAGGLTLAQDQATSAVYGMPREAILLGAASKVLALEEIGPLLAGLDGHAATSAAP
jgi:two-component system chemotaxis response regulator CheB